MWEGECGSSGAGESERERETVSLGRDIHKWIKRALVLYKHIELTGDLCTENVQNHVTIIGMNMCRHIEWIPVGTHCVLKE